jgi:polyhydroxyalkanoate synthesis regulator phasin
MFGKKKLAVGLAAVVALTTVAGAGVASAHGGGFGGEYGDSIRERAAEILGVDPADLQDALQTAREEAAREQLAERLTAAVEDETITQAEMDEILAWVDSKPEVLDEMGHGPHIGMLPLHAEGVQARLDALVEAGTITQEQADEVSAWVDAAPESLSEVAPDRGGFGRHGDRGFHGRGHRGPFGFTAPEADDSDTSTSTTTTSGAAA